MPSNIKVRGEEISVTTANSVSGATLVRVYASNNAKITVADENTNVLGSMTIPSGRVEYVEKSSTDTIASNVAILCTKIAYNT